MTAPRPEVDTSDANERAFPHKRLWRITAQFRPLLQAYGRVWEGQAGVNPEHGGSPMEALDDAVEDVEIPIIQAIAEIDLHRAALNAEVARLREALTPSRDTKYAYWGSDKHEISDWTGIKTIMRLILERAALAPKPTNPEDDGA